MLDIKEFFISIIIPAYNSENNIEACIESCINQTYRNIEVIIVNDGSTDNTKEIIEKYANNDCRIRLINQINKGAIEARKTGMKIAEGEYILFVDSDDFIEENTIEKLVLKVNENMYDLVVFGYRINGEKENINLKNESNFLKNLLIEEINGSLWNKLIRRDFLKLNNVEVPNDVSFAEDLAFMCSIAIKNPNVGYLNEYLYNYNLTIGSTTQTTSSKLLDINKSIQFIKSELIRNNLFNDYIEEFEYCFYRHNLLHRIWDIFYIKSPYSKNLYDVWKKENIDIKANKYYQSKKKINKFLHIVSKNYYFGRILCKLYVLNKNIFLS